MIDFSKCKPSGKIYEGSFWKKGIIYKGEKYIIKANKRNKKIFEADLQETYNNSVYSEYIACKVIKIIGFSVQDVLLGIYREGEKERVVVACKDFLKKGENLYEFQKVKSSLIENEIIWKKAISGDDNNVVDLLKNLKLPQMNKKEFLEFYYIQFILDAFIGNFDRHNGNWGYILTDDGKIKTSPIYDCGSSLFAVISDEGMKKILQRKEIEKRMRERHFSAIKKNGKNIKYYEYLENTKDKNILLALKKVVEKIDINKIQQMIMKEKDISDIRKRFYCEVLKIKYNTLLKPVYDKWFNKKEERKVMSVYMYDTKRDKFYKQEQRKDEEYWNRLKKKLDESIKNKKVRKDGKTLYTFQIEGYDLYIMAYDIGSEENAKRLCKKFLGK